MSVSELNPANLYSPMACSVKLSALINLDEDDRNRLLRPGEPWGRNTIDAMSRGVHAAVAGGAWKLVERYAMHYGGFPLVVATGGDAEILFKDDELVSRIVPDLALRGMALAWRTATGAPEDAEA